MVSLVLAAVLLIASSAPSRAQAAPIRATEQGGAILVQVTDTSINPLPGEVVVRALGLGVRLSAEGTALVVSVPDGLYLVRARHDGHRSESGVLRVAGDTARISFVLRPGGDEPERPDALDAAGIARARLHSFIRRAAAMTDAVFVTRGDIERRGARTVSDLLRTVPHLTVGRDARGRTIVRSIRASGASCAGGMVVLVDGSELAPTGSLASDAPVGRERHAEDHRGTPLRLAAGGAEPGSHALRWVSPRGGGLVLAAHDPATTSPAMASRGPRMTDINRMKASSVIAVELYLSAGAAPPEFRVPGADCGVVSIWTVGPGV